MAQDSNVTIQVSIERLCQFYLNDLPGSLDNSHFILEKIRSIKPPYSQNDFKALMALFCQLHAMVNKQKSAIVTAENVLEFCIKTVAHANYFKNFFAAVPKNDSPSKKPKKPKNEKIIVPAHKADPLRDAIASCDLFDPSSSF